MPLKSEDLEDALHELRTAGRDDAPFTFEFAPYPRLGCATGPPLADVIVTNTHTGLRRIYADGPGRCWTGAFSDDVRRRAFWAD